MSKNEKIEITHYSLGICRETSLDILLRWENEYRSRLLSGSENYVVIEEDKVHVTVKESAKNLRETLNTAKKDIK